MSEELLDDILENDNTEEENGELYEHIRIVVDKGQAQERIDTFLTGKRSNAERHGDMEDGFIRAEERLSFNFFGNFLDDGLLVETLICSDINEAFMSIGFDTVKFL